AAREALVPVEVGQRAAGGDLPQLEAVVFVGRDEPSSVGAECQAADEALVPVEGPDLLARDAVPELQGLVEAVRSEVPAVGAEGHCISFTLTVDRTTLSGGGAEVH